jgi:hypothetical protein
MLDKLMIEITESPTGTYITQVATSERYESSTHHIILRYQDSRRSITTIGYKQTPRHACSIARYTTENDCCSFTEFADYN